MDNIGVETYIEIITPWVVLILTLVGAIYAVWTHKLDSRIDKEIEERKEADDKIMLYVKDTIKETITTFKGGIRDEIEFRNGVMSKQDNHIEKLFSKIGSISSGQDSLHNVVMLNMQHQEEICKLKHEDVAGIKKSLEAAVSKQEAICRDQHSVKQ